MGHVILAYLHFEVSSENHHLLFLKKYSAACSFSIFTSSYLTYSPIYMAELLFGQKSVLQILVASIL